MAVISMAESFGVQVRNLAFTGKVALTSTMRRFFRDLCASVVNPPLRPLLSRCWNCLLSAGPVETKILFTEDFVT